jgi:hypothetical protein
MLLGLIEELYRCIINNLWGLVIPAKGSSFFSFEHFPVPPMIVEKNPVFPTFHNLTVKSMDEYDTRLFPF